MMSSLVGRAGGYSASTLLLAGTSIVTVPILVTGLGATSWTSLATGMAAGVFGGILVSWGWGIVGPSEVASLTPGDRYAAYQLSIIPRLLLLPFALLLACGSAYIASPTDHVASAVMAAATASYGLAAPWYFIGASLPSSFFLLDALPRAATNLIAAYAVLHSADALVYAVIQVLGCTLAICLTHFSISSGEHLELRGHLRPALVRLRSQHSAVAASAVSAVYLAFPLILVARISPVAAPEFALGDRFLKWGTTAAVPLTQALQGWIPAHGHGVDREKRGIGYAAILGVAMALGCAFSVPWLSSLLTRDSIGVSYSTASFAGLALLATCVTRVLGPAILVPLGRTRWLLRSALGGALVGGGTILPLLCLFGSPGAMLSVALAELAVLVVQIYAWKKSEDE